MSRMRCIGYAAFLLLCGACSGEAEGNAKLKVGTPGGSASAGEGGASALAGAGNGVTAGDDAVGGQSGGGTSGSPAGSGGGGSRAGTGGGGSGASGTDGSAGMLPSAGMGGSSGGTGLPVPPEEWGVYDIGDLPSEMTIAFPAPPEITDEIEVSSVQEFNAAASQDGTRVRVVGILGGGVPEIAGSDIEVVMNDGAAITSMLFIRPGVSRVALLGGRYEKIEMNLPSFWPMPVPISTDILIDGVVAETNDGTAIRVVAHRAAVLRSRLRSTAYGVYSAAAMPVDRSQDLVIAGNHMFSTGDEATIRLVDVTRSVTVENRAENMMKHTYRIHGLSTDAFASRNVFVTGGVGWGFLPESDNVGRAWFDDNEIYHRTTDLFYYAKVEGGELRINSIDTLIARNNRAYSRLMCLDCYPAPEHWVLEGNMVLPERDPPPAN